MSDCIQGVIDSLLNGCFGLEDAASDCAVVVLQQRQQLEDYREEVRELKAQLADAQALLPTWQEIADYRKEFRDYREEVRELKALLPTWHSADLSRPVSHVRAFPELVLGDLSSRSGRWPPGEF